MQIKGDLDTLERTKDDELKKFKSQNIHFDFGILVRIKELMVEVSSNCMELTLKVLSCFYHSTYNLKREFCKKCMGILSSISNHSVGVLIPMWVGL